MLPGKTVEIFLGIGLSDWYPQGWHHGFVEAVGYGSMMLDAIFSPVSVSLLSLWSKYKRCSSTMAPPSSSLALRISALSCQACKFAAIGPLRNGTLSSNYPILTPDFFNRFKDDVAWTTRFFGQWSTRSRGSGEVPSIVTCNLLDSRKHAGSSNQSQRDLIFLVFGLQI